MTETAPRGIATPSDLTFDASRMIAALQRQRSLHLEMAAVLQRAVDEVLAIVEGT